MVVGLFRHKNLEEFTGKIEKITVFKQKKCQQFSSETSPRHWVLGLCTCTSRFQKTKVSKPDWQGGASSRNIVLESCGSFLNPRPQSESDFSQNSRWFDELAQASPRPPERHYDRAYATDPQLHIGELAPWILLHHPSEGLILLDRP